MIRKTTLFMVMMIGIAIMAALSGCGSGEGTGEDESKGNASAEATSMVFETVDTDGNKVDSAELFAENKVTMVNVWATFCPPCIEEMPYIEKIREEYSEKGAGIVGVVIDVPEGNDELLQDAKDIMKETGVTYKSLRAWEGIDSQLQVSVVPTTFFVDSEGKILGDPIQGADIKGYTTALDGYLK